MGAVARWTGNGCVVTYQDEELGQLRVRLRSFGLASGGLGLLALLFRLPRLLLDGCVTASHFWHLAAACVLFVLPIMGRREDLSRRALLALDLVVLPLSALGYGLMGRSSVWYDQHASALEIGLAGLVVQYTVLLATSFGLFARAIYVPSTGRRTFLVTAACLPGMLVTVREGSVDAIGYHSAFRFGAIAGVLMWWTLATVLTTLASNVIYGLRREVHEVREYGQYTLEKRIGEGGMGIVYQARHAMLRRPTALKLLPPERAGGSSIARFEKEVRLTARLSHPNTVTIFDYGRARDGVFYYAMELLDGETLEDIVAVTGPLPADRVLQMAISISGALAEAHELGLVHRDVKPANVMLCAQLGGETDVAKVLDFGLVRDENAQSLAQSTGNAFAGTPLYMSPEAIASPSSVTAAGDLYSLGALVYFALVGEHVFDARSTVEICASHLHQAPPSPFLRTTNEIPEELSDLVLSCLEKTPANRPASARALRAALQRIRREARLTPWTPEVATRWWEEHRAKIAAYREHCSPKKTRDVILDGHATVERAAQA